MSKIGSADDVAKLASLIITTHLLETTYDHLQDHIDDIVKAVHDQVKHEEQKAQVKHAIADIIDILAARELLMNGEQRGKDFLDFVLRLSADTSPDLRRVGAGLLQRLTSEVPSVQPLLWPHLMEYLLMPGCTGMVTPVLRCLNEIITKKSDVGASVKVDFGQLTHVDGPCAILARLLVLVSAPVPRKRGMHILTFMLIFAKQINKHVRPLWGKRIPLLQLYLKNQLQWRNKADEEAVLAPGWEQSQWELWLLELLDDTIKEIGLEEWNAALVTAMEKQLALYEESEEKTEHAFLIKALGLVLKNSTSRNVVTKQLSMIEKHVASSSFTATCQASAMAFGICSMTYMDLVLERLSVLAQQKRRSNFFARFQDKQAGEQQHRMHNFVLVSISQVVKNAPKDKVVALTRDIISKFILPFLKGSADSLKLASLKSLAHLVERVRTGEIRELPHHEELLKETIECLKQGLWSVEDKQIALNAILQLIKCPPPLSETTQCSLIKASLTFVLPGLILEKVDEENPAKCANDRKETLKVLLSLIGEVISQKPLQTTLDEVFSHVEPWMKHEARNGREVALTVYKCALQALLSQSKSIQGTGFSSAPYLITCVIPRCFDCCQQVQELALQVLNLLMQLLVVLEHERGLQDAADAANDFSGIFLVRATTTATATDSVSPSPSPTNANSNNNIQVATEISSVLSRKLRQKHVVRLLIHLADCDDANSDSGGTDRVIRSLVDERKREFANHSTSVMESLLCRLVNLAKDDEEYKGLDILAAICAIIAVDFDDVTQHLLSLPVFGNAPHLSRQLQRLWGAVALERETAIKFLILSLRRLTMSELFAESCGSDGIFKRTAKHDVLSAAACLGRMLQEKDAKDACEEVDFSYAFVPLVTSMCCYFGIRTRKTWPENRTFPVLPLREATEDENDDIKGEEEMGAFGLCKWALCSFLVRRDCPLVAKVTERLWEEDKEEEKRGGADIGSLCCLLCDIYEALINFYPHFLPSLASNLEPLLLDALFGRRIAAAAFFRQTLCNKSLAVDADMRRDAISNLLTVVQWEKSNSEREDEDMLVLTENGDEEKETTLKSAIARKEIRRKESNSVRILCLQGLAEAGEHCKEDQKGCGLKSVLSAFLLSIHVDDGPECDVNLTAIRGLHILLLTAEQHGNADEVRQLLPEMASKVMLFVDRPKEAAAAISCFTQLSVFISDANAALNYAKNVHDAMVSLLLHCSSEDDDVRQCSRRGLAQIFDAMLPQDKISQTMEELIGLLLDEEKSDLDYDRTVAAMSDFPEFSSMFSSYLSSAVDHFSAPKAHSRACAVRLAAALADRVGAAAAAAVDAESVCGGLAALLALDKDADVKEAAAKAIGNTFARLRVGIVSGQQQNHSGID